MNCINVDWSREAIYEEWEFVGASLIGQKERERLENCKHGNKEESYCSECDCYPDDAENNNMPMMNYAYPLNSKPTAEMIIKVCEETNCTVAINQESGEYFLALTGGGMNLSQDIAYAYILCDGCIDWDMLSDVNLQVGLSIPEDKMKIVLKKLERQVAISIENYKVKLKEIKKAVVVCEKKLAKTN